MLTTQEADVLVAKSVNGILIRITEERLNYVYTGYPEMKGCENLIVETIETPDLVLEGDYGALLAVKKYEKTPVSENKYLVVVYKESSDDGFLITSYFTRRYAKWRKVLWQR